MTNSTADCKSVIVSYLQIKGINTKESDWKRVSKHKGPGTSTTRIFRNKKTQGLAIAKYEPFTGSITVEAAEKGVFDLFKDILENPEPESTSNLEIPNLLEEPRFGGIIKNLPNTKNSDGDFEVISLNNFELITIEDEYIEFECGGDWQEYRKILAIYKDGKFQCVSNSLLIERGENRMTVQDMITKLYKTTNKTLPSELEGKYHSVEWD